MPPHHGGRRAPKMAIFWAAQRRPTPTPASGKPRRPFHRRALLFGGVQVLIFGGIAMRLFKIGAG